MPLYSYRCPNCGHTFDQHHAIDQEPVLLCPSCGKAQMQRIITSAPKQLHGMAANAGTTRGATKEELRDKWAAETPKFRRKLVDKLGEEYVSRNAPELGDTHE
jgi:putative FmdB family regulatory protein